MAQEPMENQDLLTDCWPQVNLFKDKYNAWSVRRFSCHWDFVLLTLLIVVLLKYTDSDRSGKKVRSFVRNSGK